MRTYAIVNQKGGVGKTTTAIELAYILATSCGLRVLLCDGDGQGNTTDMLRSGEITDGMASVILGDEPFYECLICQTDIHGLDLLPAGSGLSTLDMNCLMGKQTPNFFALREFIETLEEDDVYDAVVIDCPPHYSMSSLNAIAASTGIIIPTGTDAYSVTGMEELVEQLDFIRQEVHPGLRILGALITKWHKADVVEDAVAHLRENAPVSVFQTVIRRTDKVEESSWARQCVQQWSPFSAASRDYRAFVAELLDMEGVSFGG